MGKSYFRQEISGFTLLELLCCVAIVGILASVAVPAYYESRGRAIQTEGIFLLKSITDAETAFFIRPRISSTGVTLLPCILTGLGGVNVAGDGYQGSPWIRSVPNTEERNMRDVLGVDVAQTRYYVSVGGTNIPRGGCNTVNQVTLAAIPGLVGSLFAFTDVDGDFVGDAYVSLSSMQVFANPNGFAFLMRDFYVDTVGQSRWGPLRIRLIPN